MILHGRLERSAVTLLAAVTAGTTFALLGPATGASAAETPAPGTKTTKGTSVKTKTVKTKTVKTKTVKTKTVKTTTVQTKTVKAKTVTSKTVPNAAPSRSAFIAMLAPAAQQSQRATGVPASVTIAQAILESGWGASSLATGGNNFFGIKCGGGVGLYGSSCGSYRTKEYVNGGYVATTESFRRYPNVAASLTDYGSFLRNNSRYRAAFAHVGSPDRFIRAVHQAGYATSPTYASSVIALMRQYNLYRFDL